MTELNSYTGGTNITAGTLALVQPNALFRTGVINVSGGTFDLGGVAQKTGLVTLTGGTISHGTINASGYTLKNGAISAVIGDVTSPAAATAINKVTDGSGGGGTVVLSNVNTYTGGTYVTGGTLQLTANGALPAGRALIVNGGTLRPHRHGAVRQHAADHLRGHHEHRRDDHGDLRWHADLRPPGRHGSRPYSPVPASRPPSPAAAR